MLYFNIFYFIQVNPAAYDDQTIEGYTDARNLIQECSWMAIIISAIYELHQLELIHA